MPPPRTTKRQILPRVNSTPTPIWTRQCVENDNPTLQFPGKHKGSRKAKQLRGRANKPAPFSRTRKAPGSTTAAQGAEQPGNELPYAQLMKTGTDNIVEGTAFNAPDSPTQKRHTDTDLPFMSHTQNNPKRTLGLNIKSNTRDLETVRRKPF